MEANRAKVAEIFGVALTTVDGWRRRGCPCEKVGKAVIFDTQRVFQWVLGDGEELDLNKERARLTQKQTEKTELQIEALKETLVDAEEIEMVFSRMVVAAKTKLLSLPSKVASTVYMSEDLSEIQQILRDNICECLEELSPSVK